MRPEEAEALRSELGVRMADLERRLNAMESVDELFRKSGWSTLLLMLAGMQTEAKERLVGVSNFEDHRFVVGQITAFGWLIDLPRYVEVEIESLREELAQLGEMYPTEGSTP